MFEPRQTRSRSASRRLASKTTSEVVSRKHEAVKIITGDDEHIVPMDFRLKRESFDGANFTQGIAHYDAAKRSDPQKVAEYVTDLFQHLYKAEVRCCLPTKLSNWLLLSVLLTFVLLSFSFLPGNLQGGTVHD